MKILDRYILRGLTLSWLATILVFSLIITVWDIAERVDDFYENDLSMWFVLTHYYAYLTPYFLIMLMPFFVFIAAVFYTSRLADRMEIVAMFTGGMSFFRFLIPYVLWASLISAALAYSYHNLHPYVAREKLRFENEYLGWAITWTDNTVLELQEGTFMLFRTFSMRDSVGYNLVLDQLSGVLLHKRTYANQFTWKGDSTWLLKGVFMRSLASAKHDLKKLDSLIINLPITPEDFDPDIEYSIEAMTTKQLKAFIKEEERRGSENIKYYYVKLYERYAMPFTLIILTLLGVTIASRKVRGGTGLHIAIGLAIGFSYIFVSRLTTILALNTPFPAWLGVWLPNFIYLIVTGIVIIWRLRY